MTAAGWVERFDATTGRAERRLPAGRLTAWRDFADRCGACTVMGGNVAGLAEGLLGGAVGVGLAGAGLAGTGLAGTGLAASGADCARAEAVYSNPGISTAVKAS
jgi:hypothetical protein